MLVNALLTSKKLTAGGSLYYPLSLIHFINLTTQEVRSFRRNPMQWTKPAFQDIRIGFEVTMYFEAR